MNIRQSYRCYPACIFKHEWDEIMKCTYPMLMVQLFIYIQMCKLEGTTDIKKTETRKLFTASQSVFDEAIANLVRLGLLQEIVTKEASSDDELINFEYDITHNYSGGLVHKEIIIQTTKTVEVVKKKTRNAPSDRALRISDAFIKYNIERYGIDNTRKRAWEAIKIDRMLKDCGINPDELEETVMWYIRNYKEYYQFLPKNIGNIWEISKTYRWIRDTMGKEKIDEHRNDGVAQV